MDGSHCIREYSPSKRGSVLPSYECRRQCPSNSDESDRINQHINIINMSIDNLDNEV